jgi:ABC-type glycerol-3-phosphate transport system substrate-binding protein
VVRLGSSWWVGAAAAVLTAGVILWPGSEGVRNVIAGERTILFTVWGMPFEDLLFRDRYARGFEASRPGVRVDYQRYNNDIVMKYNAWHARRKSADVMRMRITDYHGMAQRGMLRRLDVAATPDATGSNRTGFEHPLTEKDLEQIPAHLRELLVVDGPEGRGIYGIPQDNAQYGLFYNKQIFAAYNAVHADDPLDVPSTQWTWDDLRDAAKRISAWSRQQKGEQKGQQIGEEIRGFDCAVWSWPFMTLFAQAGGRAWASDGTCTLDQRNAGVEALRFLRTLIDDGSFRPQLSGYMSGTGPDALFARGRTALFMDGSWRIADFDRNAPDLEYAVVPLPRGPERLGGNEAIVSGCVMWAIGAHTEHAEDAIAMFRYLIAPEQAIEYWDTLRVAPPANLAAMQSEGFKQTRGVLKDADDPSKGYEIAPMQREKFEDRAAWLVHGVTPGPDGKPPAFVPVGPFQTELEEEIARMLNEYLKEGSKLEAHEAIRRAADNVRGVMSRAKMGKDEQ